MSDERSERIRERAHALWEREGRPDGRETEHWEQAEREIDADDSEASAGPDGAAEYDAMAAAGGGGGGQGVSTSLQPGGTAPSGGPGTATGSLGTGGGSTADRPTGAPKRRPAGLKGTPSGS